MFQRLETIRAVDGNSHPQKESAEADIGRSLSKLKQA